MVTRSSLEELARSEGCCLFGVAELTWIDKSDFLLEPELLIRLPRAISLAAPVSTTVLATIHEHPNQLYFHHYRQLNALLDRISLRMVREIEQAGFKALAIAASQIVDWQNQRAHLSHKRIAQFSGLGWIGRNNLLVTPEYGSQVRLATVLTNMPLEAECGLRTAERGAGCGECRACVAACPAQAIHETPAEFQHQACYAKLKEFQSQGHVGQFICGICVRACTGSRR